MTPIRNTVVVGVGLLGASLALAGRKAGALARVVGVGRSRANLETARALGAIDEIDTDLESAVRGADLVVLAAPVDACVSLLERAAAAAPPSCTITDVASVKRPLVATAERLGIAGRFVGAHPMAGGTAVGAAHADADLFRGRTVAVMPPTANGLDDGRARVVALWRAVGASVVEIDAELHDRVVAKSSHLPQMIASCLAALVAADPDADLARALSGGGLRDTTRIAMSDPGVWIAIARANRDQLVAAMDGFAVAWTALRDTVDRGDGAELRRVMEAGARLRRSLDEAKK